MVAIYGEEECLKEIEARFSGNPICNPIALRSEAL